MRNLELFSSQAFHKLRLSSFNKMNYIDKSQQKKKTFLQNNNGKTYHLTFKFIYFEKNNINNLLNTMNSFLLQVFISLDLVIFEKVNYIGIPLNKLFNPESYEGFLTVNLTLIL